MTELQLFDTAELETGWTCAVCGRRARTYRQVFATLNTWLRYCSRECADTDIDAWGRPELA